MAKLLSLTAFFISLPLFAMGQDDQSSRSMTPTEAIAWVSEALNQAKQVEEYSCILWKQERLNGGLREPEAVRLKVRNEPKTVCLSFVRGPWREYKWLYVESKHEGRILTKVPGLCMGGGKLKLDPLGAIAMRGTRHPCTEWDIISTTHRFIQILETEKDVEGWDVWVTKDSKINGRKSPKINIRHPHNTEQFQFHLMHLFVDDELQIPTRVAYYRWPETEGAKPELVEAYTFIELNQKPGFTQTDFDDASFLR